MVNQFSCVWEALDPETKRQLCYLAGRNMSEVQKIAHGGALPGIKVRCALVAASEACSRVDNLKLQDFDQGELDEARDAVRARVQGLTMPPTAAHA